MATNKIISKPKTAQTYAPPKPIKAKASAIKASQSKDRTSNALALGMETISEQEALALNQVATEINQQLERIHKDMQDIIRDMRAMRGAGT